VFDNCQDAPQESGFHEMLSHGLESVPEGITVFILSRTGPPPQFARLQANNRLHVLGWDDIRFTMQETEALVNIGQRTRLSTESLAHLHKRTEGWAAGLVLLIAGKNFGALGENFPGGFDPANIFDYFASEIFDKTDETVRSILLKTSFLSRIGAEIAGQLTGNSHAAQILDRLSRDQYFIYRHRDEGAVYQYHPLFREFLQARARAVFSPEEINAIRAEAALIIADSGQTDEAIDLLLLSGRWDEAAGLIMANAQAVTAQGRNKTLEGWLRRLPDDRVMQEPWLAYWLAMCRLLFNPAEARTLLEKSFAQFSEQDDAKGLYLSWAGIIETFYLAWNEFGPVADRWIPEFEALSGRHPAFLSVEMEARVKLGFFAALFWGKPRHPDLPKIVERLTQIMLGSDDHSLRFVIGSNIVLYHTWTGPAAKAKFIFDLLQPAARRSDADPLALHLWFGTTAMYAWLSAEHDVCASNIAHAVALGEKTGVRPFEHMLCGQGVSSALSQGDVASAERFVARIAALDSPRRLDRSYYHNVAASVAWQRGDWKGAVAHGEQGLRLAEESKAPLSISLALLDLAITWFDMGRIKEAEQGCARALAASNGLTRVEFICRLFQAWFALDQNDKTHGIASLRQALAIGAEQGFVNHPRWRSAMMSRICARALDEDIETDYVRDLIRKRGLFPEGPPEDCERWPWPVKINTLGRFEIFKDGKPFRFSRKIPKKPIELLKALIAFGGRNVSETRLNDTLWPDAAGDASHRAFNITLIRLRELLGLKEAILLRDGCVTLDERYFWIDVRVFERLLDRANGKAGPSEDSFEDSRLNVKSGAEHGFSDKAFDLYKGSFLPDEKGMWAISPREKLRGRFLGQVEKSGRSWEDRKKYRKAIECYMKGLETDDLFEEFYKRTMICYLRLGRKAEAVSIYRRCTKALGVHGLTPSLESETIYNQLIL
jgi:DNA-binding SARP family transcriptional activator